MRQLRSFFALALAALPLGCAPSETEPVDEAASALGQPLGAETEPNGTVALATPITKDGVVRAHLAPNADEDFYSFSGSAGERVYVNTMTAFSSGGVDTLVELIGPDGVTVIESDDNDGSFGSTSSSVAGALLSQSGTHTLRVRHPMASNVRPYDLHIKTRAGSPTPESEPNNSSAAAQALPASGWVSGNISSVTDVDVFALSLAAGDTVFASLDLDPERNGTELNATLGVGLFSSSFVQVNNGLQAGPDSEALVATVKSAGVYRVSVSSAGGSTGNYHLSVSVHPAAQASCVTYSSAGGAIAIPTGPGVVTSTINVPGNPRISDIDVSLNMNHANPPDLDVMLQSPKGNQVGLFVDMGSSSYPNMDLSIDDEAAFPTAPQGLMAGLSMQPMSSYRLDWFDGEDAGGTWTLRAFDDASLNAGSLNSWSLTICSPPAPPSCAGGVSPTTPLATDFEGGAAGFTHAGTLDSWALGTPSLAPHFIGCNSGSSCFKTNLAGAYPNSSSQDLVSPPINLTTSQAPIRASWAMKYQLESASYDRAYVLVREVGGANPRRVFEWTGPTMTTNVGNPLMTVQEAAGWGVYTADLDAYAGKTVELVFHLDADTSTALGGLAIDDVSVSACPGQICGNGVKEGAELCDDGDKVSGDGCDSNCTPTGCGNGIVTMGEACDDGNFADGDGCDSNCTFTGCGNGVATTGEACDDGNVIEGDGCDSNCTVSACGNGVTAPDEVCDDGDLTDGDGCDSNCTPTGCGNGIITMGEVCDDGNKMNGDGCDDGSAGNCTVSACGNGVAAGTEACDDGDLDDGDGCDSNCTITGCGNGIPTMGEACDDGDPLEGDGCDSNCTVSACGNGIAALPKEVCDDGNLTDGDGCDSNCTPTGCGNGIPTDGEQCDDGDKAEGDECDSNCTLPGCGNGVLDPGEACDDGDAIEGDGCDSNCTATSCGNGIKDPTEGCDDGNTQGGDGCSATCGIEGSSTTSGGGGMGGSAGSGGMGGAGGSAGSGGAGGSDTGGAAGSGGQVQRPGGCGCSVPGDSGSTPWPPALAGLGLALLARRRRAR